MRTSEDYFVGRIVQKDFGILDSKFPIWLSALSPIRVRNLVLLEVKSVDKFMLDLEKWGNSVQLQEKIRLIGAANVIPSSIQSVNPDCFLLISGNFNKLQLISSLISNKAYFLLDSPWRRRSLPSPINNVKWKRLSATQFGAPVQFTILVGWRGFDLNIQDTKIRRSIKNFIDFSIRPRSTSTQPVDSYTDSDLLVPDMLSKEIFYSTHFSATGHGCRSLTNKEKAACFGLEEWNNTKTFHSLPPLQVVAKLISGTPSSHEGAPVPKIYNWTCPPVSTKSSSSWLPTIGRHLPHAWMEISGDFTKAVKEDSAAVPTSLWDLRCTLPYNNYSPSSLARLRLLLHCKQVRQLYMEIKAYLSSLYGPSWALSLVQAKQANTKRPNLVGHAGGVKEFKEDFIVTSNACADALHKWSCTSWWRWDVGSRLLFWRWESHSKDALLGFQPWIQGKLPKYFRKMKRPKVDLFSQYSSKLQDVANKGYISLPSKCNKIPINSLFDWFGVPKGDNDIRMVYNGTSCGLNAAVWAPSFWLPTAKTAARLLSFNYCFMDKDLGEMFLNFPLHPTLAAYSGVDLTHFKHVVEGTLNPSGRLLGRWERCWMGLRPSPFWCVKFFYLADEFARGNHQAPSNSLRWDKIILNLPSSQTFNPSLPWVMKWDSHLNRIAGDIIAFVDDLRASAFDEEAVWNIARQYLSKLQYLGLQDAARKTRPPTRDEPSAWAGSVFKTTSDEVKVMTTQEKWEKARRLVQELFDQLNGNHPTPPINYKRLEVVRGFLCHMAMTYQTIFPFLKGFHLSLCKHLPKRDREGWKLPDDSFCEYLQDLLDKGEIGQSEFHKQMNPPLFQDIEIPEEVVPVERLKQDLEFLKGMFDLPNPIEVTVRSRKVFHLMYGFADASGTGFGSSMLTRRGIRVRVGVWGRDEDVEESSNWKEFTNSVEALELEGRDGQLGGGLVFLNTDSSTVESVMYKGNSKSPKLHALVIRAKQLEYKHDCRILVSHVSGLRMQFQGTDGLSRGTHFDHISSVEDLIESIPFDKSAIERVPELVNWIKSWTCSDLEVLSPEDWFVRGHDLEGGAYDNRGFWRYKERSSVFLWAPPPAAADVALEELRKARIKRQTSSHVFVCPRLLTSEWLKQLHKAADCIFEVPANNSYWPHNMFEPLKIGLCFPFIHRKPWQLRGTPKMLQMGGQMRKVFKEENFDARSVLQQFFLVCHGLPSMSEDVVRRVLYFQSSGEVSCEASRGTGGKRHRGQSKARGEVGQKRHKGD